MQIRDVTRYTGNVTYEYINEIERYQYLFVHAKNQTIG